MPRIYLVGNTQREYAHRAVREAPKGCVVSITKPKRTIPQNDKLWAILTDISKAQPDGRQHTPDVWKCLMMKACGHAVQFELGIDGQPFPVGYSSSKLNKEQMCDLITCALEYGDRHGVEWKEPVRAGFMEAENA